MAPIGEAYFPPLDRCFSGEHQLLSWKNTYVALSQLDAERDNGILKRHLTDPQTIEILARFSSPYSAPTSQTKSSFETKTSAINVTPSPHAHYDIKQVKDDTLWLSKETNIDEVAALRIALLEWQTRSAVQLLRGNPGDQATNVAGARGINPLQASFFDPGSSLLAKSSFLGESEPNFDVDKARRQRLLETYLSERRYILKTSEYVTFAALCNREDEAEKATSQGKGKPDWLDEVGNSILSSWSVEEAPKAGRRSLIVETVDSLRARFEALREGSGWLADQEVQEDIELAWGRNQLVETIHIMQILLNVLEFSPTLLKAPAVIAWFNLMGECGSFEVLQLPHPALQGKFEIPLRSLGVLVSLAVLNTSRSLDAIIECSATGVSTTTPSDGVPYILDSAAVSELNEIFISLAPLRVPSPSVLAWGILMHTVRETALVTRETREIRQSLRAADKYGAADSSDTDAAERPSGERLATLKRRSSTGSDTSQQSTILEEISDTIAIAGVDGDPITYLASNAVQGNKVFEILEAIAVEYCTVYGFEHEGRSGQKMRSLLLDVIRLCPDFVDYSPVLLIATMAVLTGSERYWDTLDRSTEFKDSPTFKFLKDNVLRREFFLRAFTRFPHESSPFLHFCRALTFDNNGKEGMPIWSILEGMDTFTCAMPMEFTAYKPVRTQEESDHIELTDNLAFNIIPVPALPKSNRTLHVMANTTPTFANHEVLSGTQGEIENDSKPFVVVWNQEFSGLVYIGKVLRCACAVADLRTFPSSLTFSPDVVGDIIGLITYMLSSILRGNSLGQVSGDAGELAQTILGSASDGLDRNQDVVSVIFEIFEKELYQRRKPSDDAESVELLVQCIQFTYALLPLMPDRVWPFLGRSGLLGIGKDESRLSAIVATQEMVLGRYEFLLGCIRLYDALVEDVLAHVVSRNAPSKAVTRFGSATTLGSGIPQAAMQKVLFSFTRVMIEVFESTMNWRFTIQEDRMEINALLCSIFQKILQYTFDIDDNPDLSKKLVCALAPSAEYIVDVFLSRSNNDVTVLPFLHILGEGIATPTTTLPTRGLQYWNAQVKAVLSLTSVLVKVNRFLHLPSSHLETQMFNAAPILAKVYVAHESYKLPVIDLFDALVRSAAATGPQPPSLLGHLGQETANQFLDVLSMLDQPLNNDALASAIWRLLSAVVSKRQQWFAIFVLTGSTPRDTFKDESDSTAMSSRRSEPILNIAMDALANIEKLEPRKALWMLEFVELAADFWPWVLNAMNGHPRFFTAISEYAAKIGQFIGSSRSKSSTVSTDYERIQMASLIANILSMYTHHALQSDNPQFARTLVNHLQYLIKNAILPPSYNVSLHGNLRHNFEAKFPGCSLANFKRTTINRPQLGESFYYDLNLAKRMLVHEPAWRGKKGQGFAEELKRANVNLSLVEAQINLFHSWKTLLVELSGPLAQETKFQKLMAIAAADCLKTNAENSLPDLFFQKLEQSQADLAFSLMQRLLEVKSVEPEVKDLLHITWNTIRAHSPDLGAALEGDGADYYRMLLRILYLAIQAHTSPDPTPKDLTASQAEAAKWSSTPDSVIQTALEILTKIIAQGFRALTVILHDSSHLVHPSDFSLLTAILRSILHIPSLTRNTTHLLSAFSDAQSARCASTLLSWSDQLATNGDPIYGDLSIHFLLELSSVPILAESLATEGVLSHVLSTNLIRLLQSRPFGPFDNPPRMYAIWARGILPLLLNLLHAVGAPLAAEISAALNTFPHQLSRASNIFAANPRALTTTTTRDPNTEYITLSLASEAVNLALITTILQTLCEAGASAVVIATQVEDVKWDRQQVKEDAEGWLQRRGGLRERIVPTNEREEGWARGKPVGGEGGYETRLEEKVVEEMKTCVGILEGGGGGDG